MALRLYLAGGLRIERGGTLLHERLFPGRQGRLAFSYLVTRRGVAVPRDELAAIMWPDALPRSWDAALSAVISNLRTMLGQVGLSRADAIAGFSGCYRIQLPPETWVDMEAAVLSIDRAEGAVRAGNAMAAYGWAGVAGSIARRPFLPGESGSWIEQQRAALQNILVRALDCFAAIFLWNGELAQAERAVEEALTLEPFRETSYQQLMRIHAARGNRADAVRAYERCRRLLADELGISPAPQTEAVYLNVLALS